MLLRELCERRLSIGACGCRLARALLIPGEILAPVALLVLARAHGLLLGALSALALRRPPPVGFALLISQRRRRRCALLLERRLPLVVDAVSMRRALGLQLTAVLVELRAPAFGCLLRALGAPARALELLLQRADRHVRLVEQLLREPPLAVLQPQVAAERRQLLGRLAREPRRGAQLRMLRDQPEHIV